MLSWTYYLLQILQEKVRVYELKLFIFLTLTNNSIGLVFYPNYFLFIEKHQQATAAIDKSLQIKNGFNRF